MRTLLASFSLLLFAAISAAASTAVSALRMLPPEEVRNLAMVEGREGTPDPERWRFLVFDPEAETGLREIVIKGMQRSNNQVSQFADRITKAEVFGPDAIRVDSDRVAQIALQFGAANNMRIAAMHYDLRKGASDGPPLWTVVCVDDLGSELGRIVISATRGTIIMHPGFSVEPQKLDFIAEGSGPGTDPRNTASTGDGNADKKTASQVARKTSPTRKVATPLPVQVPRRSFFQRLFGGNTR
jgi:hypothetical protein